MQGSPFPIRGVVEGFYGVFYTFPERNDLIDFISRHGYNFYIYGPKNDRQHRARWWEPYPAEIMEQFAQTVANAQAAGVTFCYAISPISYATADDFDRITAKLEPFFEIGVRSFSVFMDDIMSTSDEDAEIKSYQNYAAVHTEICNRLYSWLHELSPDCTLSMCPVDYHGTAPFSNYMRTLGQELHPNIDIFYTGPKICSPTISVTDAEEFASVAQRAPLLWDNYPANDLVMRSEMHIGPVRGRDAALYRAVRGVVINPMAQAEASKIPLLTWADFLHDPHAYDAFGSWERALHTVGGAASFEALSRFAENSLYSCLEATEAPKLAELTCAAITAAQRGESYADSAALQALGQYVNSLDEAGYTLKNRMTNLHLRKDLLPWIEALEGWAWLGKHALLTLAMLDCGGRYQQPARMMEESLLEIGGHNKRIAGKALMSLAAYVRERINQKEGNR